MQTNPLARLNDHDGNQTDESPFYCTCCLKDILFFDTALMTFLGSCSVQTKSEYIEVFCSRECKDEYDNT